MRRDNSSNITQLPGEPDHAGEHPGSTWEHASSLLPQVSYAWRETPAGNSVPILGQTLPFPPTSPSVHRSTEQSTTVAQTDRCTLALPRPQFPHLNFFNFYLFSSITLLLPTQLPPPSCIHAQSCNPMDCSPPGSSVHGLFQARILERIAISFSKFPHL